MNLWLEEESYYLILIFLSNWRAELKEMNKGKEGARFHYPNSLIWLLATVHTYLFPYREPEGFLRVISVHIKELKGVPDFTTVWWRVSRINIKLDPSVHPKEDVVIAVDSTGIKVANRGEWIRRHDKCSSSTTRKGFIKIHVAVDTRSKLIVSMKVTKEDVGDGRMLKSLIRGTAINVQTNIKRELLMGHTTPGITSSSCMIMKFGISISIDIEYLTRSPLVYSFFGLLPVVSNKPAFYEHITS